jgi:hypothetical protein
MLPVDVFLPCHHPHCREQAVIVIMPEYWYSVFCKTMHITLQDAGVCLLLRSCHGCYVGSIYGEGLVANSVIHTKLRESQSINVLNVGLCTWIVGETDRRRKFSNMIQKTLIFFEMMGTLFEMFSLFWWRDYLCGLLWHAVYCIVLALKCKTCNTPPQVCRNA